MAATWGLVSGSALLVGAGGGFFLKLPRRLIAAVTAFGSGVLISALAFDMMQEAFERGGTIAAAAGFLVGAAIFTGANFLLSRRGAANRKSSGEQPTEEESAGSGTAIALGALVDAVPESIMIGLSLLQGGAVSMVAVVAIFLSNIPEGLSSSAGMRAAGRNARYVFGIWAGITLLSGFAAWLGYVAFQGLPAPVVAATSAVAAGAILSMLVDTMIPEAFAVTGNATGLISVLGFLLAFVLSKLAG